MRLMYFFSKRSLTKLVPQILISDILSYYWYMCMCIYVCGFISRRELKVVITSYIYDYIILTIWHLFFLIPPERIGKFLNLTLKICILSFISHERRISGKVSIVSIATVGTKAMTEAPHLLFLLNIWDLLTPGQCFYWSRLLGP